jgi:hypothetical protein
MGLKDRIPSILPIFRQNSDLGTVVDAIDSEFDKFGADTTGVQESLFVKTAEGQSLDLIGEELSIIARRRGRSDDEYRKFIQGLVPAFQGRGTERDVEIAVAAGVTRDRDAVDLRQDFSGTREYEVELLNSDWIAHRSGLTRDLAEIADPVSVDRIDPVYLFTEPAVFVIAAAATDIAALEERSEVISPVITGAQTQSALLAVGLSSDADNLGLEPLSTDGFVLSLRDRPTGDIVFVTANTQFAVNPVSETATSNAGVTATRIRQMTETESATPSAGVTNVLAKLSIGLSSANLGTLSQTSHPPLSTAVQ